MSTQDHGQKDAAFRTATEKWDLVDALMGGTDSMRAAGQLYLPKFSAEDNELYAQRVGTSTLFNAYKKALETNVGRITAKPIQVEGGSVNLEGFVDNVDSTGRSLNEFTKDVLTDAMNHGVAYILVDFPRDTAGITLENINTIRPYFVDISAPQVLSIRSANTRGIEDLVYFKYAVTTQYAFDGWDDTDASEVQQIREYQKVDGVVSYRVKEQQQVEGSTESTYVTIEEGVMGGLTNIPIIPVYANRTAYMMGAPLFNDLAELNIRHWQSSSDQQWILHFARAPILFAKGMEDTDENGLKVNIVVGPNSVVLSDRADADMKYVEHGGTAIASGQADLDSVEDQMSVMGLDVAIDRTGGMTATSRAINAAGSNSLLQSVAVQMEDSLITALMLVEMFYNSTTPFTVDINKEYIPVFDSNEMKDVWEMYRNNMLTASDVLREGKRRNLLTPSHIIDDDFNTKTFTTDTE